MLAALKQNATHGSPFRHAWRSIRTFQFPQEERKMRYTQQLAINAYRA